MARSAPAKRVPQRYVIYDLETSGLDPATDQIIQFGVQLADENLEPVQDGYVAHVVPRADVLVSGQASLVHRIGIDRLRADGANAVTEFQLAGMIHDAFLPLSEDNPNFICGFNSGAFDDQWLRHLMYRNMLPVYDHEWRGGNRRLDVYSAVSYCRAYAPGALKIGQNEGGSADTTLTGVCAANGIPVQDAHDALGDVRMTLAIMRKIREFDDGSAWRDIQERTDRRWGAQHMIDRPVWAASPFLRNRPHGATLVLPIAADERNQSRFYCIDLAEDPTPLLELSPEEIRHYMYLPMAERAPQTPHIPILTIDSKSMPLLRAVTTDRACEEEAAARHNVDLDQARRAIDMIERADGIGDRVRCALDPEGRFEPARDYAYRGIYAGGFISDEDQEVRGGLRLATSRTDRRPAILNTDLSTAFAGSLMDKPRQYDLALRAKWGQIVLMEADDQQRHILQHPGEAFDYAEYLAQVFARESIAEMEGEFARCRVQAADQPSLLMLADWRTHNRRALERARSFYRLVGTHRDKVKAAYEEPAQRAVQDQRTAKRQSIDADIARFRETQQERPAETPQPAAPEASAEDNGAGPAKAPPASRSAATGCSRRRQGVRPN